MFLETCPSHSSRGELTSSKTLNEIGVLTNIALNKFKENNTIVP